MKNTIKLVLVILFFQFGSSLMAQDPDWNQFGNQLGATVGEFQSAHLQGQLYRADLQKWNLLLTDSAMKALVKGDVNSAILLSDEAIETLHYYSTAYFIAAMAHLKNKDYLNAHRYILLYERVGDRYRRKDSKIALPAGIVESATALIEKGYDSMSSESIRDQIKTEPWRYNMLRFNIHPSGYLMPNYEKIFHARINLALQYEKYFWFNRKHRLSIQNHTNGISFKALLSRNINFTNSYRLTPELTRFTLRPGFYLGKVYLSPLEYRRYDKGENLTTDYVPGTHKIYDNSAFVFSPEIRLYPLPLNSRAHNRLKVDKPRPKHLDNREIYFIFNYDRDRTAGATQARGVWSNKRDEIQIGMGDQFYRSMFGVGQIHEFQQYADGYETDVRYLYFSVHFHFSIGIF